LNEEQLILVHSEPNSLLAPSWDAKMSSTLNKPFYNIFVQISTLRPGMHQKITKHGRCCMQNYQLPTKSHVELENNSKIQAFVFPTIQLQSKF